MKILFLFFIILSSGFFANCSSTELSIESLPVDLDIYYSDNEQNFKFKPPLDWQIKKSYDLTVFVPPDSELESRAAFARIEIRYEKTDKGFTPEEFKDMITEALSETDGIQNLEILEYGGVPSNAYITLMVEHESKKGTRVLYFRNILTADGYFQVAGSAIKEKWTAVESLLKTSISTFIDSK